MRPIILFVSLFSLLVTMVSSLSQENAIQFPINKDCGCQLIYRYTVDIFLEGIEPQVEGWINDYVQRELIEHCSHRLEITAVTTGAPSDQDVVVTFVVDGEDSPNALTKASKEFKEDKQK